MWGHRHGWLDGGHLRPQTGPPARRPGGLSVGIKRHTFRALGQVQLECYFAFKPEASELKLGEMDVRAWGVLFDVQDGNPPRAALDAPTCATSTPRAANAEDAGRLSPPPGRYSPSATAARPCRISTWGRRVGRMCRAKPQLLCYNEIATKMNWHYLRVGLGPQTAGLHRVSVQRPHFRAGGNALH